MTTLLRSWHWAGGGLPGGLIPVLGLMALWAFFLYRILKPMGVLRSARPLSWLLAGWLLLAGAQALLRILAVPTAGVPRLAVWPPDPADRPDAHALMIGVERGLRLAALEGRTADWQVQVGEGILQDGRIQPRDRPGVDSLMQALELDRLLMVRPGLAGQAALQLWRRAWRVTDLMAELPLPGGPDDAGVVEALFAEHGIGLTCITSPAGLQGPLYSSVADSASRWLELPVGELPLWEDLRRARLSLELNPQDPDLVRSVNRGLAAEDSAGAEGYLLAARWFMEQGEWDSCEQALTNALSLEPLHPEIHWLISALNEQRLEGFGYQRGSEARARCLGLQPLHLAALHVQAPWWMDYRRGDLASAAADRALHVYPHDPELMLLRGNLAYRLMEYARAQQLYRQALDLRPGDVRVWRNLGQLLYIVKDYAGAIEPLRRAVELGSPPELLHLLGVCYRLTGQRDLAIQTLRRRMKLGGDRADLERTRRQLAGLFPEGTPEEEQGE